MCLKREIVNNFVHKHTLTTICIVAYIAEWSDEDVD